MIPTEVISFANRQMFGVIGCMPLTLLRRARWRVLLPLLSLFGAVIGVRAADELMVVSATAAPDYMRTAPGQSQPRAETYVFTPGRHFSGAARDASEEKSTFEALTLILARGLVAQRYFPVKDPAQADLVIVVHWGTTLTYEDPIAQETLANMSSALAAYQASIAETGMADSGALNEALSNQEHAAAQRDVFVQTNAALLGYKRSLTKEEQRSLASEEEKTMRSELGEPRYFVVLMAYDYRTFRTEKKARLRWVTRVSVRSPGNNYAQILPSLVLTASDYFGQQRDEINRVPARVPDGTVKLGDPHVVSQGEDPSAAATRKK